MKRIIIIALVVVSGALFSGCATPTLHESVINNDIGEVRSQLGKSADVNSEDALGCTPLNYAAESDNTEIAQLLIEKGADVNSVNSAGDTSLCIAALFGNSGVTELLIQHGAKVNRKDSEGMTPLFIAKLDNNENVARILIAHGGKAPRDKEGKTVKERQMQAQRDEQEEQQQEQAEEQPQAQQQAQQPAQPQKVAEATPIADCLSLAAALKACDQTGGFMAMGCKAVARSQYDCPAMR